MTNDSGTIQITEVRGPYYTQVLEKYNQLVYHPRSQDPIIFFGDLCGYFTRGRIMTRIRALEGILFIFRLKYDQYFAVQSHQHISSGKKASKREGTVWDQLQTIATWLEQELSRETEENVLSTYYLFYRAYHAHISRYPQIIAMLDNIHTMLLENVKYAKLAAFDRINQ